MDFSSADLHHLRAADGWLDLGNWQAANDELENITPELRAHPSALQMRSRVYLEAKHWELAVSVTETLIRITPDCATAWIHRSYALHELGKTSEAESLLLPALDKFPSEATIPYNLACYACRLGNVDKARELLSLSFERGDAKTIKLAALDDPDLAELWQTLGK